MKQDDSVSLYSVKGIPQANFLGYFALTYIGILFVLRAQATGGIVGIESDSSYHGV